MRRDSSLSLSILKPDCLARGLQDRVMSMMESSGLTIVYTERVMLSRMAIDSIYERCLGRDFYIQQW